MPHVLPVIQWALGLGGFAAACILAYLRRNSLGRPPRVRGSALVYEGRMQSGKRTEVLGHYATLKLDDNGLTMRNMRTNGNLLLRVRWKAPYADISQVQVVQQGNSSGLLLRGPGRPVVFWARRWAEIAGLLELRGIPVCRDETKLRPEALLLRPWS